MPAADGTFVRASLLALTIACAPSSLLAVVAAPGLAKSTPNAVPSPPAHATVDPSLYDIVGELARTDSMKREVAATLRDTADRSELAAAVDLPPVAPELKALAESRDMVSRIRYMELQALQVNIRERARDLSNATAALAHLTRRLVAELDRLDREVALWPQRAERAREREAPPEVQRRIEAVVPELAALRVLLLARRDQYLIAYERAVRAQARLDSAQTEVVERRERIKAALRAGEAVPIWRKQAGEFSADELFSDRRVVHFELVEYARKHGERATALFAGLTLALFLLLRQAVAVAPQHAGRQRPSVVTAACGALLLAIPFAALFAPLAPIILYRIVALPLSMLAAVVATRGFAATIPATAWTLAFALLLNLFRPAAEVSPVGDWLLHLLQIVPFGSALVYDWRRGALSHFLSRWPRVSLGRLVRIVIAVLTVAVIVDVFGYADIAGALVALMVIAPAYAFTFAAMAAALDRAFAGLLSTPLVRGLRSVRERGHTILATLHRIVVLAAWAAAIPIFALSYATLDDVIRIGTFIANGSVSAGDVTITLSAILSALLVVGATWLVTKLVRFILDHEILPRLDLRTGVPIAISTIVGYVLAVAGFVLTMAALGIDLTKVTLLAGAVGIGVGMGLQNVVNNFASGLILMLERPINVGDQIDVGGVVGEVKRIGVRSSTIRTGQGAEVIVPNSDLASKQVTNWTLSDRARRYEIDVGVEYGSDPSRVLQLLEGAAAEVPEVQKVPPPRALFTGFGDSSLDFRLFAWVESVDIGVQAQNGLRMAILRTLDAAGIAIPFPQRDLHIRYAPAGPGPVGALAT